MQTTYRVRADELTSDFVKALKVTYKDKEIEIIVSDVVDDTDYLLSTEANRDQLLGAIKDIESGDNLVSPSPSTTYLAHERHFRRFGIGGLQGMGCRRHENIRPYQCPYSGHCPAHPSRASESLRDSSTTSPAIGRAASPKSIGSFTK